MIGAIEALEDVLALFGRQSGTRVGDVDLRHTVDDAESYPNRSCSRCVGAHVREEVVDDLAQPVAVAEHDQRLEGRVDPPPGIEGLRCLDCFGDDLVQLHRLERERAPFVEAREQQQVVDEQGSSAPTPG